MPKVDMIATKDFTYATRRLVAEQPFQARNPLDARILERVRGVAKPGKPEAPNARVREVVAPRILTTEEVLGAEVVKPKVARKPSTEIKSGKPGGSKPGARARKAKAKK